MSFLKKAIRNAVYGGFDYVKPEPKKGKDLGLDDLKDLKMLFRF